jgi:hypothetical protein
VQSRQPSIKSSSNNQSSSSSSSSQQQPSRADTPDHSEEGDDNSKVDDLSMTGFHNNHKTNDKNNIDKYGSDDDDDDDQFRRVDSINTPLSLNTNAAIGSLTPTTVSRDNGSNNSISQEAMDTLQMLDNEGIDNPMSTYGASGGEEEEEEGEEEDDKRIEETLTSSSSSSSSIDDHNPLFVGCRHVDYFEKVKMVDEGAYGVVFSARNRKTGELVALKKVKISKVLSTPHIVVSYPLSISLFLQVFK